MLKLPRKHTALNRCSATDTLWNRNAVSLRSSVARVRRRPRSFKNSVNWEAIEPRVSNASGMKTWLADSGAYLSAFLVAAFSTALPAVADDDDRYDAASVFNELVRVFLLQSVLA